MDSHDRNAAAIMRGHSIVARAAAADLHAAGIEAKYLERIAAGYEASAKALEDAPHEFINASV